MNTKRILICGDRSFAAKGLKELLIEKGYTVECFSRGETCKEDNIIRGDVYKMSENPYLKNYDVIINFIIIKDGTIEDNIRYIDSVMDFCRQNKVNRLLQISSISVYPNGVQYVNENSKIESNPNMKGGYASIKVAVDNHILAMKGTLNVSFIRPGFIIEERHRVSLAGIVKPLPLGFGLLLGNKKTSLPLINKRKFHEAIMRMMELEIVSDVYLVLENSNGTKMDFAKRFYCKPVVTLPQKIIQFVAHVLYSVNIFDSHRVSLIQGLFKDTYFDSSESEYGLELSFSKHSIAVIGAGAYGSYTINRLLEAGVNSKDITLIDVGNYHLKDEDEIGYGTSLTGVDYTGLKKGRFFGFGGASGKWGGQLLMFSDRDFKHPSSFMRDIIAINKKHQETVFRKFHINNSFKENTIKNGLFTKTGVWLGYFSRNLFLHFKINKTGVLIKNGLRVAKFYYKDGMIRGLEMIDSKGCMKHGYYDQYFLCAGAFESNRIMLSSGLCDEKVTFSDHLSQRIFEIEGKPVIDGEDYQFRLNGTSLITKRIIGEVNDVSYFANPIYNAEFPFFQNLKRMMFKGEFNWKVIKLIINDIPSIISFIWEMIFWRKIYIYHGKWHVYIDIENPSHNSYVKLLDEKDSWGIDKLEVNFEIPESANVVYSQARDEIKSYLDCNSVKYKDCVDKIHADKSEDTYHPYGMFLSDSASIEEYFNYFKNMLIVNTGILPRAGGINTTASCFPIIEEYISRKYGSK